MLNADEKLAKKIHMTDWTWFVAVAAPEASKEDLVILAKWGNIVCRILTVASGSQAVLTRDRSFLLMIVGSSLMTHGKEIHMLINTKEFDHGQYRIDPVEAAKAMDRYMSPLRPGLAV